MNAWRWWMRRQVHHGWNTRKGQAPCLCWSMDEETWGGDAPGYGALADEYLAKPADPTLIDGFDFEFSAHPHSLGLAMRMADWLGQWGDKQQVPDFTLLADALEDAFWHAARRLREGLPALYLDQLGVLSMGPDGPSMAFDADLTAKPEPAAAAGAALSGAVHGWRGGTVHRRRPAPGAAPGSGRCRRALPGGDGGGRCHSGQMRGPKA